MEVQSGSKGKQTVAERLLELPRGMVLVALWLMGALLFGLCGLTVYGVMRLVVGA